MQNGENIPVNSVHLKSDIKHSYYPLFLDITDKQCLVLGGGKVAERKVAMLLQFNARVIVVSPFITKVLLKLHREDKIECFQRVYTAEDLNDAALIFACTDNSAINKRIKKDAIQKNIPVNVVDNPDLCDFIVPSIVKKGDLTIAISTSGTLPLLSKKLREKIEETITDDYLEYLHIVGEFRKHLIKTVKEGQKRNMIMKKIERMDIQEVVATGLSQIKTIFGLTSK
ncbi:MAG: siroheme synthase [Syntrophus sp. (in: bacteria)]|nr:siroheme synthase [Syntrophus sp. (in: bacteria)]